MVVIRAIKKWRHYLIGCHYPVRTDQRSLKFLQDQHMVKKKWLSKLLGYDFDIEYKPSHANKVANALSCLPAQSTLLSLPVPQVLQL